MAPSNTRIHPKKHRIPLNTIPQTQMKGRNRHRCPPETTSSAFHLLNRTSTRTTWIHPAKPRARQLEFTFGHGASPKCTIAESLGLTFTKVMERDTVRPRLTFGPGSSGRVARSWGRRAGRCSDAAEPRQCRGRVPIRSWPAGQQRMGRSRDRSGPRDERSIHVFANVFFALNGQLSVYRHRCLPLPGQH